MNEFEREIIDRVSESVRNFEVKVTEKIGNLSGDFKALKTQMESDHQSVKELIEKSIETDTARLNKHGEEIDKHSIKIASFEEWQRQFELSVAKRITTGNSISAIAAVIIAFLLSKFL